MSDSMIQEDANVDNSNPSFDDFAVGNMDISHEH